jgi:hypothetical protein
LSTSRDLLNYEKYARKELPQRFRQSLEAIFAAEIHPVKDQIIIRMEDLIRNCQEQTFSSYRLQHSSVEQTVPVNAKHLNPNDEQLPRHQFPKQEEVLAEEDGVTPLREQVLPENVGLIIPNSPARSLTQYEPEVTPSVAESDPSTAQEAVLFSYPSNDTDQLVCGCSYFCTCPRNPRNQYLTTSHIYATPNTPMILDMNKRQCLNIPRNHLLDPMTMTLIGIYI